jgi:hypothetical protein
MLIIPLFPPQFHPLRDAVLSDLRTIAHGVVAYKAEFGALPKSLEALSIPNGPFCEGYRLVVAPKGSFLVIADHLLVDDARVGGKCHFACDENFQIWKLPAFFFSEEAEQRAGGEGRKREHH